ncbi:hypothetical protein LJC46_04290 [Desulfovibrio sp. OttesenSCG-928-G15]|nr:hypothetical protein [Desulfovibrio sp. OttesenSCG-928-G15]
MSRAVWSCLACMAFGALLGGIGTYKLTVPILKSEIAALEADREKYKSDAAQAAVEAALKELTATEAARKVEDEAIREITAVATPARKAVQAAKAVTGGVDIDAPGPDSLALPVHRMREAAVQAGSSDSGQADIPAGTSVRAD